MDETLIQGKIEKIAQGIKDNHHPIFPGSERFGRFRAEHYVLSEQYNENPNSLNETQKKRLSNLEKKLALARMGVSVLPLALAYAADKFVFTDNDTFTSIFQGTNYILSGLVSLGFFYMGLAGYKNGRDIENNIYKNPSRHSFL